MLLTYLQEKIPLSLKTKLKPFYRLIYPNRLHGIINPTFRCTYKCSYCPVCSQFDYGNIYPKSCEKTPEEWLKVLEKLPQTTFFILGGEPFLYNGLPELINQISDNSKHNILGLVTNASMPIDLYKQIKNKMHMNISFHREFAQEDEFIEKVLQIKDYHHVAVNIVAIPDNIPFIPKLQKIMKQNNIELHVDPYFGKDYTYSEDELKSLPISYERVRSKRYKLYNSTKTKLCTAGQNYYCLMQNGDALTCTTGLDYCYSDLRKDDAKDFDTEIFKLGNVFDDTFKLKEEKIKCPMSCYSHCDMDYTIIKEVK